MSGGNKFSQIPEWVIDADISDGAFRLYAVLMRYADNKTGKAFPSLDTLASRLRKNEKSVRRYAKELSDQGVISIQNRGKKSNVYQLYKHKKSDVNRTHMSDQESLTGHSCPPQPDIPVPVNRTQMSNELYPQNYTHLTKSIPADAGPQELTGEIVQGELIQPAPQPDPPATKEHPHQLATKDAYEKTGKAFDFVKVMGIAKWLINERGLTIEQTSQAIVAVYQQGKPLMKQTLGQYVDGHHRNQKAGYNDWANLGTQFQNYMDQKGWLA